MEASYFLFNNSSDDTLDVLKQFLPEIEQELRQQIEPGLLEEFAQLTTRELRHIEEQAEEQYHQALETLEDQFEQLKTEKNRQLSSQLTELEDKLKEHEMKKVIQAQEKFLQDNFDSKVLTHSSLQEILEQLENEIGKTLIERYSLTREKKSKELRIRLQSREQRERIQLDRAIKSELYQKSGLQELRQEVKDFRISLASQKSKYNIKINKLNKQIQDLNKKCQEKACKNTDQVIEELEGEIQALKEEAKKQEESFGQDMIFRREKEEEEDKMTDHISQHKVFSLIHQPFNNYPETQYLHQDIDLDSEDSIPSQSSSEQQDESKPQIPMPPQRTHFLPHFSSNDPLPQPPQSDEIYLQMPRQPLLNFNLSKMLRQNWQEDDLDRYLYKSCQNQNKNVSNILPTSNFSTLYKQHLQRLNQGTKPKLRKLSEKAKQQFMLNLSSQRQKPQQSMINA